MIPKKQGLFRIIEYFCFLNEKSFYLFYLFFLRAYEDEFKKAIYEQLWMIGIIFFFLILVSVSKYYEEKYTKYSRYMLSNREGFKV